MIRYLSHHPFSHKRVLLRVDFNVSLNKDRTISDDTRIQQSIPTIKFLLHHHNKIILVSHLGETTQRDEKYSLKRVAADLMHYMPDIKVHLVNDFLIEKDLFSRQTEKEILMLENIRFYPGETSNDPTFAHELASLVDIYVNDAFGVSHRKHASVYGIAALLPSYAGLLMEREIGMLNMLLHNHHHPFVAILGGSKIATKIKLIQRLTSIADTLLIGGGLANTFLAAQGIHVGKSLYEKNELHLAKTLLAEANKHHKKFLLPLDVIVQEGKREVSVKGIEDNEAIMDIGSETQAIWGKEITNAKTIVWNGPVGKFEEPDFARGTEFIYYSISQNTHAFSVVGGGDTLAAITNKDFLQNISHISTGGGAMLEYIEKGTLPGIAALEK